MRREGARSVAGGAVGPVPSAPGAGQGLGEPPEGQAGPGGCARTASGWPLRCPSGEGLSLHMSTWRMILDRL